MLPCFHASMLPCFHASMLPCFHASMLPCFHASMRIYLARVSPKRNLNVGFPNSRNAEICCSSTMVLWYIFETCSSRGVVGSGVHGRWFAISAGRSISRYVSFIRRPSIHIGRFQIDSQSSKVSSNKSLRSPSQNLHSPVEVLRDQ